ncbi:N-acetylglucosamine-6-phosphate deacetylase [Nocardioides insulae]|uniref:N-acetylglucosamine-6-phosphate deacetylase n=1 Tax=Nocardioides insulae TaxID=394734 RepID=UPI00040B14E5|nr:N-acetylglucosamine-6-phosphate deacetylase [Nocardioides insulae]
MSDSPTLHVRGGRDVHDRPLSLLLENGVIARLDRDAAAAPPDTPLLDATGLLVLPGLLDLQVNGAGGVDVTDSPERLWAVGAMLPAYGVTAWVPTVITSAPEARTTALRTLASGPPPGWRGAVPLGLHFEGPFLAPARRGAHPERWLRSPDPGETSGWSRAAGVLMATIAPELPGALSLIEELSARGVVVSVGHTTATVDQARAAVGAGARLVTHLGNAMPPLLARDPGPVGLVLAEDTLVAGVIADGHHLAPEFLTTVWRALGPRRVLAVTDTTAALGVPDGPSRLGGQDVVVRDGTVRLLDGTLAGSAASLPHCLRVLRDVTGASLPDVVATATSTPSELLGDPARGRLRPGARADVLLVDPDLGVRATLVGGHVVHRDPRPH